MIQNYTGFRTLVRREIVRFFIVSTQTLLPSAISAALFIFVFGFSIGQNLNIQIEGVPYLHFLVPGLIAMHVIEGSYTNTSSSLFISRWHNHIQEVLLSPLSYFEMVSALVIGGVSRGIITGISVWGVSLIFTTFPISHWVMMLYFMLIVSLIFSCIGLLVGLWADNFEKLSVWSSFVITPLIFFGGVFHSIRMVPPPLRVITYLNPIYYLVDGIRYGMLGITDSNITLSSLLALLLAISLMALTVHLFKIGYKLRT